MKILLGHICKSAYRDDNWNNTCFIAGGPEEKESRPAHGFQYSGMVLRSRPIVDYVSYIVNDITNFCFRFLQNPYTAASARPKTRFLMSLTINGMNHAA